MRLCGVLCAGWLHVLGLLCAHSGLWVWHGFPAGQWLQVRSSCSSLSSCWRSSTTWGRDDSGLCRATWANADVPTESRDVGMDIYKQDGMPTWSWRDASFSWCTPRPWLWMQLRPTTFWAASWSFRQQQLRLQTRQTPCWRPSRTMEVGIANLVLEMVQRFWGALTPSTLMTPWSTRCGVNNFWTGWHFVTTGMLSWFKMWSSWKLWPLLALWMRMWRTWPGSCTPFSALIFKVLLYRLFVPTQGIEMVLQFGIGWRSYMHLEHVPELWPLDRPSCSTQHSLSNAPCWRICCSLMHCWISMNLLLGIACQTTWQ